MKSVFFRQLNIYCDESSVDNKNLEFFTIGAIIIPRDQKTRITKTIKELKKKYNFKFEIKWNKVSKLYADFYKELIDFFAVENDLEFKVIVIKKTLVDGNRHCNDSELMFYKFYYQLLKEKLNNDCQYYIFADMKSRKFKPRFKKLERYLEKLYLNRKLNIDIKHMQEYKSDEIELLQLADFFTGMTAYANSFKENRSGLRKELVEQVEKIFGIALIEGTNLHFKKFNIFKWVPRI